jgi:hypothetical protein
MAYNLYTDKLNKFNCTIDVEGSSLSKSKVRLVIETNEMSYMFNGSVNEDGACEVIVPKTKNFLSEGTKGNIKLEVIADDVYFEPWTSDFNVKTTKKVNVVVNEQVEDKPKLRVNVIEQKEEPKKIVENKEVKKVSTTIKNTQTISKSDFIRKLLSQK